MNVTTVDGRKVDIVGEAEVNFKYKNKGCKQKVIIVDRYKNDVLVGIELIRRMKLQINFVNETVEFVEDEEHITSLFLRIEKDVEKQSFNQKFISVTKDKNITGTEVILGTEALQRKSGIYVENSII